MVLELLLLIAGLIEHISQNFHHLFIPGHFFLIVGNISLLTKCCKRFFVYVAKVYFTIKSHSDPCCKNSW